MKEELRNLISLDQLETFFEKITPLFDNQNKDIQNLIIVSSSRLARVKKERSLDILSYEEYGRERNAITVSLIEIVESLVLHDKQNNLKKLKNEEQLFNSLKYKLSSIINDCWDFYFKTIESDIKYKRIDEFKYFLETTTSKFEKGTFQVAVIALMKSGKSTLLNAWIGEEYLPSGTLAETMRVVRILHDANATTGTLIEDDEIEATGSNESKEYLRCQNDTYRKSNEINEKEIKLRVRMESLKDKTLHEYGFEILDTPGTNEAGTPVLRTVVDRLLKSVDVIIYLLDYTKLGTNDEEQVFLNLQDWRHDLTHNSDRLFFVVNKIDVSNRHDLEKNLDPSKVIEYVKNIIRRSIKIETNSIYTISAEQALLGRLILTSKANANQLMDFDKDAFGLYTEPDDITPSMRKEKAEKFVKKSGLATLEDKVLNKIYDEKIKLFFASIIEGLYHKLSQVSNDLKVSKGALNKSFEEIVNLQNKITHIQEGLKIFSEENKLKKNVIKKIDREFKELEKRIIKTIKTQFGSSSISVNKFFGLGGYDIRSRNPDEVKKKMLDLHGNIFDIINDEFQNFRNRLIGELYQDYSILYTVISEGLNPIVKEIESVINTSLNIQLRPRNIKPEKDSVFQFHDTIINEIDNLINEKTQFKIRIVDKEVTIFGWKVRLPWISLFDTVYYASSQEYIEMYEKNIEPFILNEKNIIIEISNEKFSKVVIEAQKELNDYSSRYFTIMREQISEKNNSDTSIEQRIGGVDKAIQEVEDMINNIESIREEFNLSFS